MKVRHGFVSNSSTSSYIIIIPTDRFEEVISKMKPIQGKIVRDIVQDEKVLGLKSKVLNYCSGNDNTLDIYELTYELQLELEKEIGMTIEEDRDPFDDILYDAVDKYGDLVKKHAKGYYRSEYH